MTDNELARRLEHHADELPVLPTVITQLLALRSDADDYAERVVELIETEPNFSTRVLAYANSAASAPASPVVSVAAAVTRIGSISATDLVLTLGVAKVFVPRDDWDRSLWRHALQVALAARALAVALHPPGITPEIAYTAGLLHDVGRFVLFQHAPAELRRIDEGNWDSPAELVAEETAICGLNHADLGAVACERWGIPDVLVEVVRRHHDPPSASSATELDRLVELVHVADLLMFPSAALRPHRLDAHDVAMQVAAERPAWLRLGVDDLERIVDTVLTEEQRMAASLGLS